MEPHEEESSEDTVKELEELIQDLQSDDSTKQVPEETQGTPPKKLKRSASDGEGSSRETQGTPPNKLKRSASDGEGSSPETQGTPTKKLKTSADGEGTCAASTENTDEPSLAPSATPAIPETPSSEEAKEEPEEAQPEDPVPSTDIFRSVSSSGEEPIVVQNIDPTDVDPFQIAYKNFRKTSSHSDIFRCTESATGFIDDYTDINDNNDNFVAITFFDDEIQELQAFLNSFTPKNLDGQATCPKSNLKRKLTSPNLNTCDRIKRLRFTYIKVFYFERSQGFCSVPSQGGLTLGMVKHHFFNTTLPIEEYERNKIRRIIPPPRSDDLIMSPRIEKPKNIEALTCSQRTELLEGCGIQINEEEVMDCSIIRLSRLSSGCDCKGFCDPDLCSCSLSGVQCQVDSPNFPCGCIRKNCHNSMGCNQFNANKVKIHFIKTMKRISTESKRISNRLVGKTNDSVAS